MLGHNVLCQRKQNKRVVINHRLAPSFTSYVQIELIYLLLKNTLSNKWQYSIYPQQNICFYSLSIILIVEYCLLHFRKGAWKDVKKQTRKMVYEEVIKGIIVGIIKIPILSNMRPSMVVSVIAPKD